VACKPKFRGPSLSSSSGNWLRHPTTSWCTCPKSWHIAAGETKRVGWRS
jgi:hypothetical protein